MRKSCFCFYPGFASEGCYEAVLQHLLDWKVGRLYGVWGKVSHFLIAALCSHLPGFLQVVSFPAGSFT